MGFFDNLFCGNVLREKSELNGRYIIAQAKLDLANEDMLQINAVKISLYKQLQEAQDALKSTGDKDKANIASLQNQVSALQEITGSKQGVIDALIAAASQKTSFSMLPSQVQTLLTGYYSKYPNADITYSGRTQPNHPDQPYDINVQSYASYGIMSPEALMLVKKSNGFVMDIMKDQGVTFHRACDIACSRVKGAMAGFYSYANDKSTSLINEYWKFFVETYISATKFHTGSDCDDWAIMFYVLARTAGVPAQMLRISAGITRGSGEGHATNHYYASDLTWRHINSTTSYSNSDMLNMPKNTDTNDSMGLGTVWFSFNEEHSWASQNGTVDTGTRTTASGARIVKLLQHIKIKKRDLHE
jgi:hypothetical protein